MAQAKQSNAPAADESTNTGPVITFKEKKRVTLPVIKFEPGKPVFVKILGEMHLGKKTKGRGDKAQMEPATLAEVVDLNTGENGLIICATVLKSVLDENYPNNAYVGKGFKITKMEKREGRSYNEYDLVELELTTK